MLDLPAAFAIALTVAALACLARAAAILARRRPAAGRIVYNGYDRMQRRRDGAWSRHNGPPLETLILDRVVFQDEDGSEVRADLRRRSGPYGDDPLLWYDPSRPTRVTHRGPGYWFGAALLCLGTAAWIIWLG